MTEYVLRWFVAPLGKWVDVSTYATANAAHTAREHFVLELRDYCKADAWLKVFEVSEKLIPPSVS